MIPACYQAKPIHVAGSDSDSRVYIYRITCGCCKRVYIGSSYDVGKRYNEHIKSAETETNKLYKHLRYVLTLNSIRRAFREREHSIDIETIDETVQSRRAEIEDIQIRIHDSVAKGLNSVGARLPLLKRIRKRFQYV